LVAVREADLLDVLKRKSNPLNGVLIFGSDDGLVGSVVASVLKQLAAPEDVTRLAPSDVREDPARLDEVVRSQSFLGGRQLVLLEGCADHHVKLVEPFVRSSTPGNFLVLVSGSLGKSSVLRSLAESAEHFGCVPVYEDRPSDILSRVVRVLGANGLSFGEGAAERFMALCGTDRSLALNEAEKLALYCQGQSMISDVDVSACCGDQASYDLDMLIDACLGGDSLAVDRMFHALEDGEWRSLLPLLSGHLARLTQLRADADRLGGLEAALRAARPPVFFGRKAAFSQQLKAFDLETLLRTQLTVEHAVEQSRRLPDLAPELAGRLLLSLAVEARRGLRS
jgi:DNA polymerase III subunit delta